MALKHVGDGSCWLRRGAVYCLGLEGFEKPVRSRTGLATTGVVPLSPLQRDVRRWLFGFFLLIECHCYEER